MLAFDATYLTPTLNQLQLHNKRLLVGGAWTIAQPENCCIDLESLEVDVKRVVKSSSLMEFLCWDPSGKHKTPLSLASMPSEHSWAGVGAQIRGQMYMVRLVGEVLESASSVIKCVVFDSYLECAAFVLKCFGIFWMAFHHFESP